MCLSIQFHHMLLCISCHKYYWKTRGHFKVHNSLDVVCKYKQHLRITVLFLNGNSFIFLKMKLAEQSQLLVIWPFPRGVWSYLGVSEPVYSTHHVKLDIPEVSCPYPTPGHGMGLALRHGGGFKIQGDKIPGNNIFNQSAVYSLVSPKSNPSIGGAKGIEGASDVAFCDGSASVYIWSAEVGAVIRW